MSAVRIVEASDNDAGQRIDNFLLRQLRGVPRGHVYRLLRRGEVRVNGGRVRPVYRLEVGDQVRLPPVRDVRHAEGQLPDSWLERLRNAVLYEDDAVIVIDKPAGLAVHSGSRLGGGLIDGLRELRPELPGLSLVHRLDRDTSGCILLAKERPVLNRLHDALRGRDVTKRYSAVLLGAWTGSEQRLEAALTRDVRRGNERIVRVDPDGRRAVSTFRRVDGSHALTLVDVDLETGRTHQIRVHARHMGHALLGDDKYGSRRRDRQALGRAAPRLFLHARLLEFPLGGKRVTVESPVPASFTDVIGKEGQSCL